MWESIASTLLTKYLGDYIEGLQKENLHLSLLKGNVELDNLEFKKDIFRQMELPLQVKEGTIRKIRVSIPWTHLASSPSRVLVDGVFLVVSPMDPNKTEDLIDELQQQIKQRKLARAEMIRTEALNNTSETEKGYGIGTRIALRVVDKLQLEITNVHIRYEDNITDPKHPFVFGMTIEKVSSDSVDENWEPDYHFRFTSSDMMRKLFQVKNFSFYGEHNFIHYNSLHDFQENMEELIHAHKPERYILSPMSGSLKVKLDKKPQVPDDLTIPKLEVNCNFTNIVLSLKEKQYHNIIRLVNLINKYQKGTRKYKHLRPSASMKQDPKAWWSYVGTAVVSEVKAKKAIWTWDFMINRIRIKNEYIGLWKKKSVLNEKLDPEEQDRFEQLERDLSFEDIVFFRSLADALAIKEHKMTVPATPVAYHSKMQRWFESWLPGVGADQIAEEEASTKISEFNLTEDDWKKIYHTVEYELSEESSHTSSVPGDYIIFKATYSLSSGYVELKEGENRLASVKFTALSAHMQKKHNGAIASNILLDSMEMKDHFSKDSKFSTIVSRTPGSLAEPLVMASISVNPGAETNELFNYSLDLKMRPLDLVFHKAFNDRLVSFFTKVPEETKEDLEEVVAKQVQHLKEGAEKQLLLILANKNTIGVKLDIKAPTVLLPENVNDENSALLVIDLGKLLVETKPKARPSSEETAEPQISLEFYDEYEIKLCKIRALLANREDWQAKLAKETLDRADSLLPGNDVSMSIKLCKVQTDALTKMLVEGSLAEVQLEVSQTKAVRLLKILQAATAETGEKSHEHKKLQTDVYKDPRRQAKIEDFKAQAGIKSNKKTAIMNHRLVEATFSTRKLSITLVDDNMQEIVQLRSLGLNFDCVKRPYDMEAKMSITDFLIEDKMQKFGDGFKFLVDTYSVHTLELNTHVLSASQHSDLYDKHFIAIAYKNIDTESPEYQGVDAVVTANFDTFNMMVNPDTIGTIMAIAKNVSGAWNKPKKESKEEESEEEGDQQTTKVTANIGKIEITLNYEGTRFVSTSIADAAVSMQLTGGDMVVKGSLGNVLLKDLLPSSLLYENILEPVTDSQKVIDFTFQKKKLSDNKQEVSTDLHVSSVRFVALQRLFNELQLYADKMQQIKESSGVAEDMRSARLKAKGKAKDVALATILKLSVTIDNPIIWIPQASDANDMLEVNLGHIKVGSKLLEEIQGEEYPMQTLSIDLRGASIGTAKINKHGSRLNFTADPNIFQNIDIVVDVTKPSFVEDVAFAKTTVRVSTSDVIFGITDKQFKLLTDIVSQNHTEVSSLDNGKLAAKKVAAAKQAQHEERTKNSADKLQLLLKLPCAAITLIDSRNNNPVTKFAIEKLDLEYLARYDDSAKMSFNLASAVVTDERDQTVNPFQTIVTPQTRDSKDGFFAVNYKKDSNQNEDVHIVLNNPLITVVPEAVVAIKAFITCFVTAYRTIQKAFSDEVHPSDLPPDATFEEHQSFVHCFLLDMKIRVVEPMLRKQQPRGLILNINRFAIISDEEDRYNIALQECTIDKAYLLHEEESIIRIADSFNIALDSGEKSKVKETQEKDQPVHLILEYQDLKMISNIINGFAEKENPNVVKSDEQVKKEMVPVKPEEDKERLQLSRTLSLRVTLINEFDDLNPFLDLQLAGTHFELKHWSSKTMKLYVKTNFRGNYFNSTVDKWESLFDSTSGSSWPLELTLHQVKEYQGEHTLINFTPGDSTRLNVNITTDFIESMVTSALKGFEEMSRSELDAAPTDTIKVLKRPYIIRNETGQVVHYWLSDEKVGKKETIFIGEEASIKRDRLQKLVRGERKVEVLGVETNEDASCKVSFVVESPAFHQYRIVTKMPVALAVPRIVELDDDTKLVFEMRYRTGSKVLALRSNLVLWNDSNYPIEVQLTAEGISEHTALLESKSSAPVPLAYVGGEVRFRPPHIDMPPFSKLMKEHNYGWTKPIPLNQIARYEDETEEFDCIAENNTFLPWFYSVQFEAITYTRITEQAEEESTKHPSKKAATWNSFKDYKITVRAPMVLENLLAASLDYQLLNGKFNSLLAEGTLKSGQELEFYHTTALVEDHLMVGFCPSGFEWSSLHPLKGSDEKVTETEIEVSDQLERPLMLKMENKVKSSKTRKVSIWTEYCIINETGLRLIYGFNGGRHVAAGPDNVVDEERGKISGFWKHKLPTIEHRDWNLVAAENIDHQEASPDPFLFSFPHLLSKKLSIKTEQSDWSTGMSIDALGDVGVVELDTWGLEEKEPVHQKFEFSVSVSRSDNLKFWRTKIIRFAPRFMIVNKLDRAILFKQQDTSIVYPVGPGKRQAFECWPDAKKPNLLQLSLQQFGYDWSGPFSVSNPENGFVLKIKKSQSTVISKAKTFYCRVQVQFNKGTSYVLLLPDTPEVPDYVITNQTDYKFTIGQKDCNEEETIDPHSALRFTFPNPHLPRVVQVQREGSNIVDEYPMDRVKKFDPSLTGSYEVETTNDGPTRILKIADVKLHKKSFVRDETTFNAEDEEEFIKTTVYVRLPAIGFSFIDQTPQEVMYLSMDNIELGLNISNLQTKIEGSIQDLQIDNQIPDTPYPVALYSASASEASEEKEEHHPFLCFNVVKHNKTRGGLEAYDYVSLLVRDTDICVDEAFLIRVINYIVELQKSIKMLDKKEAGHETTAMINTSEQTTFDVKESKLVYIRKLHVHPIRTTVSYKGVAGIEEKYAKSVRMLLGISTAIIPSVDKAPLTFSGVVMRDPYTTQNDLAQRVSEVYKNQAIRQVYKVFGSLDIIGSPVSLINNLGSGVFDLYDKPTIGVKKITYGVVNAASNIAYSVSTGVKKAVGDQEFVAEISKQEVTEEPDTVPEGVTLGMTQMGVGVDKGAEALTEETKHTEGIAGFLKGLSKGLIKAITRPSVGAAEVPLETAQGARNQTKLQRGPQRKKEPKHIMQKIAHEEHKRTTAEATILM